MADPKTFQFRGKQTTTGEQTLTIEHRPDDPKYVATYRTYSSCHDASGRYFVTLTWHIVSVFSEKLAFVTELTTYNNDTRPKLDYTQICRLKAADRISTRLLPKNTHQASEAELQAIWKDIKTRERVS